MAKRRTNSEKRTLLVKAFDGTVLCVIECKLWKGSEKLKEAIDQLLSLYTTWSNERVALMVFCKSPEEGFTEIIRKAIESAKAHDLYVSGGGSPEELSRPARSISFVFRHPEDVEAKVHLQLMLYHFPRHPKR